MAFTMLKLKPGVNTELTPSQVEAGYVSSNLIRFRNGLAEKLGGWQKYFAYAVNGIPKALHAWMDLTQVKYLGIGSTGASTRLNVLSQDLLTEITPQELTTNFTPDGATLGFTTTNSSTSVDVFDTNVSSITSFDAIELKTPVAVGGIILHGVYPVALSLGGTGYRITAATAATATVTKGGTVPAFTSTNGSAQVTVTITAHGLSVGSGINFPLATTVGGTTISGTYSVVGVLTADTFTINTNTEATSSAGPTSMNSGQIRIHYLISLGPTSSMSGYGIGTYGEGGYGTGSAQGAQAGTRITANDWALDNWFQSLVAVPQNQGLWYWEPNTGFTTARIIAGNEAPPFNTGAFVATEVDILVAYGSTTFLQIGVQQDPMLVKWSDQGDFTDYVAGVPGSQAGERRLSTGSKIVGGMAAPQFNFLWTDVGLWAMSYIGPPGVFGFQPLGYGCGLIGQHAAGRLGANVYWMSRDNFFVLAGGAPVPMPCTVWDAVYQDLNTATQDRSFAWPNTPYNEMWFYYPRESTAATEPDAYAKYNIVENVWDNGVLARSCGIDASLLGRPIAAESTGVIYLHETTHDADGQAIVPFFRTGLYQLGDGEMLMFMDWVLPDMRWQDFNDTVGASVQFTLYAYEYLSSTPTVHGPYTVTQASPYFNPRVRARFIALEVTSNDVGTFWRLGGSRFRIAMSGRR